MKAAFKDHRERGREMEREEEFAQAMADYGQELLRYCHHIGWI